jgi:hypothetical protein
LRGQSIPLYEYYFEPYAKLLEKNAFSMQGDYSRGYLKGMIKNNNELMR